MFQTVNRVRYKARASILDQETENELGIAPEESLKLVKAASVKLTDFEGDISQQYTSLGVIGRLLENKLKKILKFSIGTGGGQL